MPLSLDTHFDISVTHLCNHRMQLPKQASCSCFMPSPDKLGHDVLGLTHGMHNSWVAFLLLCRSTNSCYLFAMLPGFTALQASRQQKLGVLVEAVSFAHVAQ